jgi:hypothetical protein
MCVCVSVSVRCSCSEKVVILRQGGKTQIRVNENQREHRRRLVLVCYELHCEDPSSKEEDLDFQSETKTMRILDVDPWENCVVTEIQIQIQIQTYEIHHTTIHHTQRRHLIEDENVH